MKQTFDLPLGTQFVYDTGSKALTLASLSGMTCRHNSRENDFSCSGLAVLCIGNQRLEGRKLQYGITHVSAMNSTLLHPMKQRPSAGKASGLSSRNSGSSPAVTP